jgi:hypothetical protein
VATPPRDIVREHEPTRTDEIAQQTLIHEPADGRCPAHVAHVESDHQQAIAPLCGAHHLSSLASVSRERLLAEHLRSRLEGPNDEIPVRVRHRADRDEVELVVEQGRAVRMPVRHMKLIPDRAQAPGFKIRDCGHLNALHGAELPDM